MAPGPESNYSLNYLIVNNKKIIYFKSTPIGTPYLSSWRIDLVSVNFCIMTTKILRFQSVLRHGTIQ